MRIRFKAFPSLGTPFPSKYTSKLYTSWHGYRIAFKCVLTNEIFSCDFPPHTFDENEISSVEEKVFT